MLRENWCVVMSRNEEDICEGQDIFVPQNIISFKKRILKSTEEIVRKNVNAPIVEG